MKKEEFLKQFPKELEYEVSKIYNTFEISQNYDIINCTEEFYTPNFWKKMTEKMENIIVKTNGIFEDSDRRQILFVPKIYVDEEKNKNFEEYFQYKLIKIEINSKFKEYEHKDFLGSIMGLNIKREMIGDLILEKNVAYIPVSTKILDYILLELKYIGKNECKVSVVDTLNIDGNEYLPKYKFDDKIIVVPSKRLDSIVAAITNLPRNRIVEPIEKGKVLVDYYEEKNKSKQLEIGSTITIKGFGKFKLFLEKGETKKGKERILIKKYI